MSTMNQLSLIDPQAQKEEGVISVNSVFDAHQFVTMLFDDVLYKPVYCRSYSSTSSFMTTNSTPANLNNSIVSLSA
jgi:hypothetical protein